jgi:NDP-sugar pyrophosphorylase family protein
VKRIEHAVIMAAGRGRRMMPLTEEIPKPMAPYKGSTLIAAGIALIRDRVSHVHVTIGYKKAMLARHVIEEGAASVLNTDGKPNCWWIYNTLLRLVDAPVYVLTCDNVVDLDFELLEVSYDSVGRPPCMLVPVRPVEGLEGDYIFREGRHVTRLSRMEASDTYCSGIQILNPARVCEITSEPDDFYGVWGQLIARRELLVSDVYPKSWFSVDTIEHLKRLNDG